MPERVPWLDLSSHHRWLATEEDRLVGLHAECSRGSSSGFAPPDRAGRPDRNADRQLYAVARHIHCFALEHLRGRPGAAPLAERAIKTLLDEFHDSRHGGWFASLTGDGGVVSDRKTAYDHAFVLLAASSAKQASLRGASSLFAQADEILDRRFWHEDEGAVVDAFTSDWHLIEPGYRGQNANMHLTEAYMAAFEATGDEKFLRRAERISALIVEANAPDRAWRIPEHFDAEWRVQPDFNADHPEDQLRPPGSLVGHWFEWSRLLLSLSALDGSLVPWAPEASKRLFDAGIRDGWDDTMGGFIYSVDFDGRPLMTDRLHWVMAEAIGATVHLARLTGDREYEMWYERFWSFIEERHIDRATGGWWHQLDARCRPAFSVWKGKPDLYHALQATLYARSDARYGLVEAARRGLQRC